MTTISEAFSAGMEEVRKSWGWFLTVGILLVILGCVCIATAKTATTVSILVFGWILVFGGILSFVNAFRAWTSSGVFLFLLSAIIRCVTGYLLLRHPDAGAEAVTMVLAVLFVVGGIFRMAAAGVIRFPRWGWTAFAGAVSVALGVVIMVNWTASSAFFIGLAIGVDLILDGSSLVGFAGALHSLFKEGSYKAA